MFQNDYNYFRWYKFSISGQSQVSELLGRLWDCDYFSFVTLKKQTFFDFTAGIFQELILEIPAKFINVDYRISQILVHHQCANAWRIVRTSWAATLHIRNHERSVFSSNLPSGISLAQRSRPNSWSAGSNLSPHTNRLTLNTERFPKNIQTTIIHGIRGVFFKKSNERRFIYMTHR